MLILYRVKRNLQYPIIEIIKRTLKDHKIDYYWIAENEQSKRSFEKEDGKVKISTIDSSKGLDYQAVFIVNVDSMPFPLEDDEEREVSLLYIGMTRAKEYLCLSYSGKSKFTKYLDEVLEERAANKNNKSEIN